MSVGEDAPFFEICLADNWLATKRLGDRLRFRYAFRGQPSWEMGLATTLHRWALRGGFPHGHDLTEREGWIIHEFQRKAHHYIAQPPNPAERLEWLALLQHHGGPTRLLDFTYSFYVAAFFALETSEKDYATIWAVDLDRLAEVAAKRFGAEPPARDRRVRMDAHRRMAETWLVAPPEQPGVLDVEPLRMNLRMAQQQGLFLFPTDLRASFEDNLFATFGIDADAVKGDHPVLAWTGDEPEFEMAPLLKILLPRHIHGTAIHDLGTMNVNALSLFGGLDGLARSLSRYLWLYDPTA